MRQIKNAKLPQAVLREDREIVAALETIGAYKGTLPELTFPEIKKMLNQLATAQADRVQAETKFQTVNDDTTGKEIEFHNLILRVKKQVVAQFGEDSNEAQAVGLKKSSERKRAGRKEVANKAA